MHIKIKIHHIGEVNLYVYVINADITNFTSVSNPWLWFSYSTAVNNHFWILACEFIHYSLNANSNTNKNEIDFTSQHRAKGIGFGFCQKTYTRLELQSILLTIQVTPQNKDSCSRSKAGWPLNGNKNRKICFCISFPNSFWNWIYFSVSEGNIYSFLVRWL